MRFFQVPAAKRPRPTLGNPDSQMSLPMEIMNPSLVEDGAASEVVEADTLFMEPMGGRYARLVPARRAAHLWAPHAGARGRHRRPRSPRPPVAARLNLQPRGSSAASDPTHRGPL